MTKFQSAAANIEAVVHSNDRQVLTLDVFANEEVIHDVFAVVLQDLFELINVVVLVRHDQVRHRQDLRVVLVRFGLLRVKRVDIRLHQPERQYKKDEMSHMLARGMTKLYIKKPINSCT